MTDEIRKAFEAEFPSIDLLLNDAGHYASTKTHLVFSGFRAAWNAKPSGDECANGCKIKRAVQDYSMPDPYPAETIQPSSALFPADPLPPKGE